MNQMAGPGIQCRGPFYSFGSLVYRILMDLEKFILKFP
ncbi:hypothetical protein SRB521_02735 [Intestinimonas butyriciproducens]|nr:hypothetical protein SRB521_02735 [Intestinimonas butyriciproducens]